MMKKTRFTITEVLVLISVLAILVSALLPHFNEATRKARRVHCAGNLNQLAKSHNLYFKDNKDFPIPWWFFDDFTIIQPYVTGLSLFNCRGTSLFPVDENSDLDGQTPYLRTGNFIGGDLEKLFNVNNGHGNNIYATAYQVDPSNPNIKKLLEGKVLTYSLYDRSMDNHSKDLNLVDVSSNSARVMYSMGNLFGIDPETRALITFDGTKVTGLLAKPNPPPEE